MIAEIKREIHDTVKICFNLTVDYSPKGQIIHLMKLLFPPILNLFMLG